MTYAQLYNALVGLCSGASFALWNPAPPFNESDDPSSSQHSRFGFVVCWHVNNLQACPSEEELQSYQP